MYQEEECILKLGNYKRKKCKNKSGRILASVTERDFPEENPNIYNKDQYRMTTAGKVLNVERRGQYVGFKKYGQFSKSVQQGTSFPVRGKIKLQKQKTITKQSMNENRKFPFMHLFTYQTNSASIQKILSAHNTVLFIFQQKHESAFQIETYRYKKLIKLARLLRAKENKSGETRIEVLSTVYYVQPSLLNPAFPTIKIAVGVNSKLFPSEMDEAKSSVYMTKMVKHLMQPSERIKKKYVSVAQKTFRISTLKTFMVRMHLDTEESLPILLCLSKQVFKGPSVVERTKQSAKEKTVPVSLDFLRCLTSALIAGATIFGIALFILAVAAGYLYYKRRQLGLFLDAVLKGGESKKK
ncbi:uncharacterized protein LOC133386863 [Rhineura floridana]|uniref:uncharacterized protein LOC133386863 n=1 Tax=Rhineura floridana TaxID=261503 RepID=UPI002AC83D6F|nr:uncharacterized protein LOC133386863 [Rhineura floridana]